MSYAVYAWDGDEASFWEALSKVRKDTDVEGDQALLCDVLVCAVLYLQSRGYYDENPT